MARTSQICDFLYHRGSFEHSSYRMALLAAVQMNSAPPTARRNSRRPARDITKPAVRKIRRKTRGNWSRLRP